MNSSPTTADLVQALKQRLSETASPIERAQLTEALVRATYERARRVYTGDGLDGYDGRERSIVGALLTAAMDYENWASEQPPDLISRELAPGVTLSMPPAGQEPPPLDHP